jgi:hypothetical protein
MDSPHDQAGRKLDTHGVERLAINEPVQQNGTHPAPGANLTSCALYGTVEHAVQCRKRCRKQRGCDWLL